MARSSEYQVVGGSLFVSGIAVITLMLYHPTNFGMLNAWVHGGMIGVIALSTLAITYLATGPSSGRVIRHSAAMLFLWGGILNVLAAAINGFVTPEVFEPLGDEVSPELRTFAWALNQTMARIAVIFHGVAMMLFGCQAILTPSRWLEVPTRVFGVVAGVLSIGILVMHQGKLDVHTALVIYGLEALWLMLVGALLIEASIRSAPSTEDKTTE